LVLVQYPEPTSEEVTDMRATLATLKEKRSLTRLERIAQQSFTKQLRAHTSHK